MHVAAKLAPLCIWSREAAWSGEADVQYSTTQWVPDPLAHGRRRLCEVYEQSGVCPNVECAFAHGESDLRERQRARE